MKDHKRFRNRIVRTFMESEGYQRIRRGEEKGPLFKYKLGEGRGRLISAKERESYE